MRAWLPKPFAKQTLCIFLSFSLIFSQSCMRSPYPDSKEELVRIVSEVERELRDFQTQTFLEDLNNTDWSDALNKELLGLKEEIGELKMRSGTQSFDRKINEVQDRTIFTRNIPELQQTPEYLSLAKSEREAQLQKKHLEQAEKTIDNALNAKNFNHYASFAGMEQALENTANIENLDRYIEKLTPTARKLENLNLDPEMLEQTSWALNEKITQKPIDYLEEKLNVDPEVAERIYDEITPCIRSGDCLPQEFIRVIQSEVDSAISKEVARNTLEIISTLDKVSTPAREIDNTLKQLSAIDARLKSGEISEEEAKRQTELLSKSLKSEVKQSIKTLNKLQKDTRKEIKKIDKQLKSNNKEIRKIDKQLEDRPDCTKCKNSFQYKKQHNAFCQECENLETQKKKLKEGNKELEEKKKVQEEKMKTLQESKESMASALALGGLLALALRFTPVGLILLACAAIIMADSGGGNGNNLQGETGTGDQKKGDGKGTSSSQDSQDKNAKGNSSQSNVDENGNGLSEGSGGLPAEPENFISGNHQGQGGDSDSEAVAQPGLSAEVGEDWLPAYQTTSFQVLQHIASKRSDNLYAYYKPPNINLHICGINKRKLQVTGFISGNQRFITELFKLPPGKPFDEKTYIAAAKASFQPLQDFCTESLSDCCNKKFSSGFSQKPDNANSDLTPQIEDAVEATEWSENKPTSGQEAVYQVDQPIESIQPLNEEGGWKPKKNNELRKLPPNLDGNQFVIEFRGEGGNELFVIYELVKGKHRKRASALQPNQLSKINEITEKFDDKFKRLVSICTVDYDFDGNPFRILGLDNLGRGVLYPLENSNIKKTPNRDIIVLPKVPDCTGNK